MALDQSFEAFTDDLSSGWFYSPNRVPFPGGVEGYVNLYRRDNLTGSYEALTKAEPLFASPQVNASQFDDPEVQAISADGKHAVFSIAAALTPDANPDVNIQLYLLTDGELHLVSVLPDGTANPLGAEVGWGKDLVSHRHMVTKNAVSDDGSRIFWSQHLDSTFRRIYVRENPDQAQSALNGSGECTEPAKACTITVGDGHYRAASSDGSRVLFQGQNGFLPLYVFDVGSETTTELTAASSGVLGTSEDLSYIYFATPEVLDAGATAGQPNIYLEHNGTTTFIATVTDRDVDATGFQSGVSAALPSPFRNSSKVTPDGRHLAFMSELSLTGYDNTDANNGEPDTEVYLYDADSGGLTCTSCNPSGARPTGRLLPRSYTVDHRPVLPERWAAAWLKLRRPSSTPPAPSPTTALASTSTASTRWCPRTPTASRTSTSGRRRAWAPAGRRVAASA